MAKRKRCRFTAGYKAEAVSRLEESGKALQGLDEDEIVDREQYPIRKLVQDLNGPGQRSLMRCRPSSDYRARRLSASNVRRCVHCQACHH